MQQVVVGLGGRRWALGVVALTVLLLVVAPEVAGSAPSGPPTQDVRVTNDPTNPVPVAGGVRAAQQGPWEVGITGTPTVNVANFPAQRSQPLWQGRPWIESISIARGQAFCQSGQPIAPGQVFFVQQIAVFMAEVAGEGVQAAVRLRVLGDTDFVQFNVPTFPSGPSLGRDGFAGSIEVNVPVSAYEACGRPDGGYVTFIGYLVAAPE